MPAPYINTMVTFLPAVFVTWRLVKILIQCNTENIRLILLIQTGFFLLYVMPDGQAEAHTFTDTQNLPLACGWQM